MTENPEILQAALEGLEAELLRINAMITAVKVGAGNGRAVAKEAVVAKRIKRQVGPGSRQRMAAAQRKRWANQPAEG